MAGTIKVVNSLEIVGEDGQTLLGKIGGSIFSFEHTQGFQVRRVTATTTAAVLDFPDLTIPAWCWVMNVGSNDTVEIGAWNEGTHYGLIRVPTGYPPQCFCWTYLLSASIICHTGTCDVLFIVAED